jgi:hypothetical protein
MTGRSEPGPFVAGCLFCGWERDAPDEGAAEQLAGSHDDQVHEGLPTAWVERVADQPDEWERRTG